MDLEVLKQCSAKLAEEREQNYIDSYSTFCQVLYEFYHKYGKQTVYFDDENYITPSIICRIYADDDIMKDCVVHALHFELDDSIENRVYPVSVDVRVVGEDGEYISGIDINEDCFNWDDNEFSGYVIVQIENGMYIPENLEEV